jgi:hypothetical protein
VSSKNRRPEPRTVAAILASGDASLLDLVDNVINKGIAIDGDVVLGVADVDLIYLRLSAVLCAADRIFDDPGRRVRTSSRAAKALRPGTRKPPKGAPKGSRVP